MQSSNKFYNAHETSAVEDLAVALVCGEADFKVRSSGILLLRCPCSDSADVRRGHRDRRQPDSLRCGWVESDAGSQDPAPPGPRDHDPVVPVSGQSVVLAAAGLAGHLAKDVFVNGQSPGG